MVVRAHKPTDTKILSSLCTTLINYSRSLILLRIHSLPARYFLSTSIILLFNILSALLVLGFRLNLLIYFLLVVTFCTINSLILSLSEGNDLTRLPINPQEEDDTKDEGTNIDDTKDTKMNILVPILYCYLTLLSLGHLPLYIYLTSKSSFLKPVTLIIFMGLYTIFFMNNCKKSSAVTQILNSISIFIFVYLCIDRIKVE